MGRTRRGRRSSEHYPINNCHPTSRGVMRCYPMQAFHCGRAKLYMICEQGFSHSTCRSACSAEFPRDWLSSQMMKPAVRRPFLARILAVRLRINRIADRRVLSPLRPCHWNSFRGLVQSLEEDGGFCPGEITPS